MATNQTPAMFPRHSIKIAAYVGMTFTTMGYEMHQCGREALKEGRRKYSDGVDYTAKNNGWSDVDKERNYVLKKIAEFPLPYWIICGLTWPLYVTVLWPTEYIAAHIADNIVATDAKATRASQKCTCKHL